MNRVKRISENTRQPSLARLLSGFRVSGPTHPILMTLLFLPLPGEATGVRPSPRHSADLISSQCASESDSNLVSSKCAIEKCSRFELSANLVCFPSHTLTTHTKSMPSSRQFFLGLGLLCTTILYLLHNDEIRLRYLHV